MKTDWKQYLEQESKIEISLVCPTLSSNHKWYLIKHKMPTCLYIISCIAQTPYRSRLWHPNKVMNCLFFIWSNQSNFVHVLSYALTSVRQVHVDVQGHQWQSAIKYTNAIFEKVLMNFKICYGFQHAPKAIAFGLLQHITQYLFKIVSKSLYWWTL